MAQWFRFCEESVAGEISCLAGGYAHKIPTVGYYESSVEDRCGYISSTRQACRAPAPTELIRRSQLRGKAGQPLCMAWRPEGDRLLCGLGNGEVANYCKLTLECEDMKRVLAASGEITKIRPMYKISRLVAVNTDSGLNGGITSGLLLLGDATGNVHVTTTNLAPVSLISIYTQKDAVFEITLSSDERSAVVGVRTAHPSLLDLETQKPVGIFKGLGFGSSALQFHPRQDLIAAGSKTNELQLWDARDPRVVLTSSYSHKGSIVSVEWNPANDFIFASTSRDHLVHIWDVRMRGVDHWKPLYTCRLDDTGQASESKGPERRSTLVSLSLASPPNSASDGAYICPWCLEKPESHRRNAQDSAHVNPTCMKWHPRDPSTFVVGDSAGILSIWRNGSCLSQVAHAFADDIVAAWQPEITCLEWNSEGTLLATAVKGNVGGSICFWANPRRWTALNPTAANCAHPCH